MPSSLSKKPRTRSPIRDMPLRDPGQSLNEQMEDRLFDHVLPWASIAMLMVFLAAWEWLDWLTGFSPSPFITTAVAVVVSAIAYWKCRRERDVFRQLRLGREGERSVGQFLQATLIPMGYTVIHDICFDDFNVDHVAIGPGGVFAIEVKTRSKPNRGEVRVSYDGSRVLVNGHEPDRDLIVQAKAGAKSIHEILAKKAGMDVAVQGVVLFPGWYVEGKSTGKEIWVLNENSFAKFVTNAHVRLQEREVRVLAEGLARFVRDRLDKSNRLGQLRSI